MTRVRTPLIAGLTAGAGTTTLAAALHARDGGRLDRGVDGGADVVVCRSDSLRLVAALIGTQPGPRPVLAVTLDSTRPARAELSAGLHAVAPRFGAVVLLPHVARWRGLTDPVVEAAVVLAQPAAHLPRRLRAYAAALRLLVEVIVGSSQLDRGAPPAVAVPRAAPSRPMVRPVERVEPIRVAPIAVPRRIVIPPVVCAPPHRREPDDDELEADLAPALVGAGWAG